jgi:hypothetical protein
MSKSLVPNPPDQAQGVIDEAMSQGKGFLVGVAATAVAVPFLGWVFGLVAGGAAVAGWSWKTARARRRR